MPTLTILAAQQMLGVCRVANALLLRIPIDPLAGAKGPVAKLIRLDERAAVAERAGRGRAGLARKNPLGMMADGRRKRLRRPLEIGELLLRQQHVPVVVG